MQEPVFEKDDVFVKRETFKRFCSQIVGEPGVKTVSLKGRQVQRPSLQQSGMATQMTAKKGMIYLNAVKFVVTEYSFDRGCADCSNK